MPEPSTNKIRINMKILVGGGTGFIGRNLIRLLKTQGYEVITVSRKPGGKDQLSWSELYLKGLPENCTAVVNLAGENILNPLKRWNEGFLKELRSSRIETTEALARMIGRAYVPPKVFVSSSAVGYYKPSSSQEYTEDSESGDDYLAELCRDWEAAAKLKEGCQTRSVIIRTGVVLGRDGGVIQQSFVPFFMGLGGRIGSGHQWFPWIHVRDIAGIIMHAVEKDHVNGVLNGVAPEAATNEQFTKAFAGAMWRPSFIPMPAFVMNCVFGPERAKIILEGQKVVPKRTLESGYQFKYPDLKCACENVSRLIYIDQLET